MASETVSRRVKTADGPPPSGVDAPVGRKELLAETLRRRIASMEMPPGAVVDEMALSKEFGISRPPVRELLSQLAAEGYIELEAHRAPRVSAMNLGSLRSFFQAAPLIYVATTQLAAANATRQGISALKAIQKRLRIAINDHDVEGRVLYNDEFHHEIGKMARNAYLMASLNRLQLDHARLGKMFYRHPTTADMQRDLENAVEQHDQIIEAMERHDATAAGELVRIHFDLSRHRMAEYSTPAGVNVQVAY